jgi:hypothetical protein
MLQTVAPRIDDARVVINDRHVIIVQATGVAKSVCKKVLSLNL